MKTLYTGALCIGLLSTINTRAVDVFFTDFESGVPAGFSGAGALASTEGYSASGFGDNYLRNTLTGNPAAATVLTLAGLPSHTLLALSFHVAIIDSWDGSTPIGGSAPPDFFNVRADGALIFSETFDNFDLSDQTYAGAPLTYGSNLAGTANWPDSAYLISLTLAHSASSVQIEWFASGEGWQGLTDESWAIDNVLVSVRGEPSTGVPDAGSTMVLFGLGCCALAGYRRLRL